MKRSDKLFLTAVAAEVLGKVLLRYAECKFAELGMSAPVGFGPGVPFPPVGVAKQ